MPAENSEAQELPDWLDVSRETHGALQDFFAMVIKWNQRINLVSAGSVGDGWKRHILDSAQLWTAVHVERGVWLDLGSGGGFPGMVIAAIARERAPELRVVLVESDRRKSVFLSEAARQLGLTVEVRPVRIEAQDDMAASVLSARAFAPLDRMLGIAKRHMGPAAVALFPKGQSFDAELLLARQRWHFTCDTLASLTDPKAVVLRIANIRDV